VDEFLGRGSTAVVWAATCEQTGDRVALKVVDVEGVDAVPVELVDREEAVGRRVAGAHVLTVRERALIDDGRVAMVMGLADGGSLRDVVTIRGALPLGEVVTALTPLASALAELHRAGVVHADVAPGNVLFTTAGRPMLADLSSAWLPEDGWPQRSLGTPGFAAPEVVLGRPPVPTSDVWSLGAVVWYARTGGLTPPPWVGDLHWSPTAVGSDETGEESGTLDDVRAALGPELAPLLVRMLADDPDARPAAAEVALALYRAAVPEPVVLVGRHPDPAAAVTTRIRREAAETRSRSQLREAERLERLETRRERRRRRVRAVVLPWARDRSSAAEDRAPRETGGAGRGAHTSSVPAGGRNRSLRLQLRFVTVAVLALAVVAGMLGLLRVAGDGRKVPSTPVAETSPSGAAGSLDATTLDGSATAGGVVTPSTPGAVGASVGNASALAPSPGGSVDATFSGAPATGSAAGAVNGSVSSDGDPVRDPVAALQRLADVRAAALVAADPVLLVGAEPAGSSAFDTDLGTITRLREQRQRYADLTFTVRSAEVLSTSPSTVVLRALVDRSAYQVVADGGSTQRLEAGAGSSLRYTLLRRDGGWRLVEVATP
jgi:hypothetical protein